MNRLTTVLLGLLVMGVILFPQIGNAGDFATKGVIELGGTASFSSVTGLTSFSISPYLGFFIIDQVELGFIPSLTVVSPSGGNSLTSYGIVAAPAYHFKLSSPSVTPFIEGQVGFSGVSAGGSSSTNFNGGARGGVKVLMGSNGLLGIGLGYNSIGGTGVFGIQGGFTIFLSK
jgi:hypothetical protein